MKRQDSCFETLRAIAIIGVVAIHVSGSGSTFSNSNWNFYFTLIWRQIVNFSVPLFLFISGYFMSQYSIITKKNYFNYLTSRVLRVYLPYLFWSLVILMPPIILSGSYVNKTAILKLLSFSTSGPYYFIALIMQLYIITPLLQKFTTKKGLIAITLINFLTLGILYFIRFIMEIKLPLIAYAGPFFVWILFYHLGLYYGINREEKIFKSQKKLLILVTIALLLSIGETYYIYFKTYDVKNAFSAIKYSSFLYSFFLINYFYLNREKIGQSLRCLNGVGESSFGIYLIHINILWILLAGLRRLEVLTKEYIIFNNQFLLQPIMIIGVIVSCMIIILITRKLVPRNISKRILGFY